MIEEPPLLTIRRAFPRPTAAQVAAFQDVPTGFVCDALGGQGAMHTVIRPIGGLEREVHAAGPALVADNGPAEILATVAAVHFAQPGDVIVAATHGGRNVAAAGDNLCAMMRNKGCVAFVTDGELRDYKGLMEVGLPAWCTGLNPNSPFSKGPGRVGFGATVAGRHVESGDMIVADRDGVVVVPFARIDAVIARLEQITRLEAEAEAKVRSGYCDFPAIEAMIADGSAIVID